VNIGDTGVGVVVYGGELEFFRTSAFAIPPWCLVGVDVISDEEWKLEDEGG
jgi:hypothetical protein